MRYLKVIVIVALILMATVGGAALRIKEFVDRPLPLPSMREEAYVSGDAGEYLVEPVQGEASIAPVKGAVNVLVVGLDNVDGGSRTDAIALAIFDADDREVRVASIPRDSRVFIPKRGWDKINHAYVYGGIDLLRETLVNLTGIPIHYFVKVNYRSFPRVVDLLGGVDIYVEKDLRYTDYSGKLFINIKKGQQHMDGRTALGYVRFRHDPLGDIGRVQRQQKFMSIVMDKLKSPAIIPKIPALVGEAIDAVDTDLSPLEALKLLQFANSLPTGRVRMFMAPGKSGYSGKISYWIIDNAALSRELVARLAPLDEGGQGEELPPYDPASGPSTAMAGDELARLRGEIVRVRILNGDGEKGLGARAAQLFQKIGIEVPYTGNARHYDYHTTNIIYPPGGDEAAKRGAMALAELCGISDSRLIREDRRAESLTLILGHDKETILGRIEPLDS
ncbi:MAG: LCP family protein [Synergistaceae bacterium]|nr:LCP family protein [Synergistaceae bacterium]